MPYRTIEPIKIEKISLWRKYKSILFPIYCGGTILLVLVNLLFVSSSSHSTTEKSHSTTEKEFECHDSVTDIVNIFVKCEHKDHILSISGHNKVCSCPRSKDVK